MKSSWYYFQPTYFKQILIWSFFWESSRTRGRATQLTTELLLNLFPEEIWKNIISWLPYFWAGGHHSPWQINPKFFNIQDVYLAYVQRSIHCNPLASWMSDNLNKSKDFITEAAIYKSSILCYAKTSFQDYCFEILMVTVTNHSVKPWQEFQMQLHARRGYHLGHGFNIDMLEFATYVIAMYNLHQCFTSIVLPAISDHHGSNLSVLTKIDFGTNYSIKVKIADCAGVLFGTEL